MSQITYPLGISKELLKEMRGIAKETGLSVADVMRQSIKFGAHQVRKRLSVESGDPDVTEVIIDTWDKLGPAPEVLYDKL